jgi:hypothetical protein
VDEDQPDALRRLHGGGLRHACRDAGRGTQDVPRPRRRHASLPQVAAKRRAPPKVPGVTLDGIRYEQTVLARNEADGGQRTGYLAAYRGASDERLWRLRVYELHIDPRLEGDVQDVYFKSMTAAKDGHELLIENERGDRFEVDVHTQTVHKLD